ncbi:MAG: DUF2284 domain-containing protein [Defluviitaleaceae bacterium]|nr:DUF2284 domain-containing protein [Defluviitaleaceae bacterium]
MTPDKYIKQAISLGAANAVKFNIADIAFDPRVVLKCIFGCKDYGKNHTCPYQKSPLTMDEYKQTLLHYNWGIILHCKDKATSQRASFEVERQAFLDGHYFAFSLSDCGLCKECSKIHNRDCNIPERARPAFHSVGIDLFKTVHKFDLPLAVAKTLDDDINWYSAVFIE